MQLTKDQDRALMGVSRWLRSREGGTFYLGGYAGTGKSTIARMLGENVKTCYCAFTNKAANVLRNKGCPNTRTLHSLLYETFVLPDGTLHFEPRKDDDIFSPARFSLIAVDEASMVGETLAKELRRWGVPILAIGDPAQLPPVKDGKSALIDGTPDVMLEEITRQARDNPIIRASMAIREEKEIDTGDLGDKILLLQRQGIDFRLLEKADQILCGVHITRRSVLRNMRSALGYDETATPQHGEKLMRLVNGDGMFNGETFTVLQGTRDLNEKQIRLVVSPTNDSTRYVEAVRKEFIESTDEPTREEQEKPKRHWWAFGYATTVHKAQGSQWDKVLLFDEGAVFRQDRRRWLYTGVTRAADKLVIVRN